MNLTFVLRFCVYPDDAVDNDKEEEEEEDVSLQSS